VAVPAVSPVDLNAAQLSPVVVSANAVIAVVFPSTVIAVLAVQLNALP
jgi:hypothetical protein